MAANLCGRKERIYQDDEIRYVFTSTKQSYNGNLKNILLWTSFREEERAWANKARLVGMFEIEWKTLHHNILVEFLSDWKLDLEHNRIYAMLGDEQKIVDKHMLVEVSRIYHTGETNADQAKMFNARIALVEIVEYLTLIIPMKGGL